MTCRKPGVITWVQFLDGMPPKIWDGEKTFTIRRYFWQLSTLIANISGMDPQMENRKNSWSTTTPPTLGEKSWCTLVHKQKKFLTCILTHPSGHSSGDYISTLTGWCALKFLYALEIARDLLTHTQTGMGPQRKIDDKIWLKIYRVPINIDIEARGNILTKLFQAMWRTSSTNKKVIVHILIHPNYSYTVSWRKSICHVVLFGVIHQLPLLREEFRLPKLTFHSDLRRRAASRRALPRTSSFNI